MNERTGRTAAEWTTLAVSCSLLLVVGVLVGTQGRTPRTPPAPVAAVVGEPRDVGAAHHVDVRVVNGGDETAANVQVTVELVIDDETITADQTLDFLAGDEESDLVFVFEDDPREGELSVSVSGFAVP